MEAGKQRLLTTVFINCNKIRVRKCIIKLLPAYVAPNKSPKGIIYLSDILILIDQFSPSSHFY